MSRKFGSRPDEVFAVKEYQDNKKWPYEDIVNLPHHVSKVHPQMPMQARAAQFAPFAALTGYEDVIDETARRNEQRMNTQETFLEDRDWLPEED